MLELRGIRSDGYHALRSVVVPVELHDDVFLSASSSSASTDISLEVVADEIDVSAIGEPAKNLAVRAASLFLSRAGISLSLKIHIVKRIPLGGGLGGGSADAAAVLRGLNAMFAEPPFSLDELVSLAAELGSDIPSMVHGGTVLMEGRGEKVTALLGPDGRSPLPSFDIVLANPGINVSTAEAYRKSDEIAARPSAVKAPENWLLTLTSFSCNILHSPNYGKSLADFSVILFNGLEEAVFALHPEIARLAARLKDEGATGVLMSGSGATVFALADGPETAERIRRKMSAECWCTVTRTLPDGVMAAHGPLEA